MGSEAFRYCVFVTVLMLIVDQILKLFAAEIFFLTFCGQICGKGSNVISRHLFSSWHMVNLIILRSLYNKITVAKLYMYI